MAEGISRREFLRWSIGAGLFLGAGINLPQWPVDSLAGHSVPDLAVARGDIVNSTEAALAALGGMGRFVKPGDKVVIKPNISFANPPEKATTTDPLLVKTLARLCLQAGAESVTVVDHTLHHWRICMKKTGIEAALSGVKGVSILPLNRRRLFEEVPIPKGKVLRKTELARVLLGSDVLISAPVAKCHSATRVSLNLKGLMGLVWDRNRMHQVDVEQAIADLATAVKSHLVVIDASRALLTQGPGGPGKVTKLDTIVVGTDPVAADAYTVTLTPWYGKGFAPRQIRHLLLAHQMGLGRIELDKVKIEKLTVR